LPRRSPPPPAAASERPREAAPFPLPRRPAGNAAWPSPVEVSVDGDRITVRRSAPGALSAATPLRESPGWLIDLGELAPGEPSPRRLLLRWSGPAEFSAAYAIETSADLRSGRNAAGGQVMALQSAHGALAQPIIGLPDSTGRFLRLTWLPPATPPGAPGGGSGR